MSGPDEKSDDLGISGHRARLRQRFLTAGPQSLADYELLELLLFAANPRGDVKPLAKQLIQRFGGFAEVIAATPERLREVKGMGDTAIVSLKSVAVAAERMARQQVVGRPVISSWQALLDYLQMAMRRLESEVFHILFLDRKNNLIADERQQTGTVDHTPVYPREVVKRALELSASAVILVHNHPSGDPTPSADDIEMTKRVVEAGRALGITVHDHVIIGKNRHASFKSLGIL